MSASLGRSYHLGEYEREELEYAYNSTIANWNLFCSMALVAMTLTQFTVESNTLPVDWSVVLYSSITQYIIEWIGRRWETYDRRDDD